MKNENETNEIESGAIVKLVYGAGCGEEFGILVESKTSEWGNQYKIITEDGEEHWTSEIRKPGERSANGSPIGCFLAE